MVRKILRTTVWGFCVPQRGSVARTRNDALRRADSALADVLSALDTGVTGDFIAQDIRRSLMYLGEISGEIGVEDLLENIFSRFCIGK